MARHLNGDDPEPEELVPAGLLAVPVRSGLAGDVLRLFRTALGVRTVVGFTSRRQLSAVLGAQQRSIVISEAAVRQMTAELGVAQLVVDPQLVAAPAVPLHSDSRHGWASLTQDNAAVRAA
ncbi:hypothetical protein SAMN05414137_114222 [Streptacidiphilus jiangxiensis]|uniref:SseB protein N-terminal domain-containing protein n=1 Tax=Streptacidiphilus jiangxiensis TaxID=235985 RepID=A0A1H7TUP8_STRJI|nr:hypothetical protein SAMN05414137_114222 [Streptacidiphilus jiangxiensis]